MKQSILDEIKRVYKLTYGDSILEQKSLINRTMRKITGDNDVPEKSELVSDDVNLFFNDLNKLKEFGGISQQQRGQINFQKNAELIQIALVLLGYDLPRFGIDGKFGNETANAVKRFKKENNIINESSSELRTIINSLGIQEKGNEISSGGEITDELTRISSKIFKDIKTQIPKLKIKITAGNDRYHKNTNSKHSQGKALDFTISPYNNVTSEIVNNILKKYSNENSGFKFLDEYKTPSSRSTGGHYHIQYEIGDNITQYVPDNKTNLEKVTPDMIDLMINKLKSLNITSEHLSKLSKKNEKNDQLVFSDIDVTTQEGFGQYANIAQKYINTVNPNAGITGDMLAKGAFYSYKKYGKLIPLELSLSQLTLEGGLSRNVNAKPIRTNNPFNVGNIDNGKVRVFNDKQEGINAYFDLISRNYLTDSNDINRLFDNFVNVDGKRYASDGNYEKKLKSIAMKVNRLKKQFT